MSPTFLKVNYSKSLYQLGLVCTLFNILFSTCWKITSIHRCLGIQNIDAALPADLSMAVLAETPVATMRAVVRVLDSLAFFHPRCV